VLGRLPKGEHSRAAKRPRWYEKQLKNRPPHIAQRGPWRPKRPKVEDAQRLDALELYRNPNCRSLRRTLALVSDRRGGVRSEFRHFEPGTRTIETHGAKLILTPRQRVPRRSTTLVTAQCPGCGRQVRYLYITPGNAGPVCQKCGGLIYKSQARSRSARLGRRCQLADEPPSAQVAQFEAETGDQKWLSLGDR
jgi:hypothetical protein